MRKLDLLEKTKMLGKVEGSSKRRRLNMSWIDSIKEITALGLQDLSSVVNHWAFLR